MPQYSIAYKPAVTVTVGPGFSPFTTMTGIEKLPARDCAMLTYPHSFVPGLTESGSKLFAFVKIKDPRSK